MGIRDPGLTDDQLHHQFTCLLAEDSGPASVDRTLAYLGQFLTKERLRSLHIYVRNSHLRCSGVLNEQDVQDDVSKALEKATRTLIQQASGGSPAFPYRGQSEEEFFGWIKLVAGRQGDFRTPSVMRDRERESRRGAKHIDDSTDAAQKADEKPSNSNIVSYAHSVIQGRLIEHADLVEAFESIPAISQLIIALGYDVHEYEALSHSSLEELSICSGCTQGQIRRFNLRSGMRQLAKTGITRKSRPLTQSELALLLNMSEPTIRKHRDVGLGHLGDKLQR